MAKRKDEGHEETDKVLSDLEKRITKEYSQAEKEISAKLDDYLRRFETKDKIKAQAVQDGKITQKEYEQWRVGQIAVGERWKEMRDTIADDLTTTAQKAKSITDGYMPEVYAINHNYGTFQVEKAAHVDTSYTLYDRQTVERLFKGDSEIYHKHGIKVGQTIAEGKQKAWDKKQVESCMIQSLLQGESIGNIATRLAKTVGDSDRKACIRNARTMTTGVENAGRVDSYQRAEDMGIDLEQEWMATIDDRTRHEHRMLDGQRVKVGEKFQIDGYELAYPADPMGEPEMIYNCRCTLVPALKGFNADNSMRQNRSVEEDYDKWKESHYSYSDPITKQDDIARNMQIYYNNEYRSYEGKDSKYYLSSDAEGYASDNFDRRITPFDSDKELKEVNPNYTSGRGGEYETNCQRCVPTFLLRKQGYDVVANPAGYGNDKNKEFVLRRASHNIYKKSDGSSPTPILTRMKSTTFGKEEIETYMSDLPDGALCVVSCTWKKGNAHVFLAEKKDGEVRYIDPQTGDNNVSFYFKKMQNNTSFFRIDNTEVSDEYMPLICNNKR